MDPATAAIMGGFGLLNGLIGSAQSSAQSGTNFYRQVQMMKAQQAFQEQQTGRAFDFEREMYNRQIENFPALLKMQSDAEFNLWRNQFQVQNLYNSPAAQVQRLIAAGVNPASVFGQTGTTGSSSMSGSALPPPSISPVPAGANASPIGLGSSPFDNRSFFKEAAEMVQLIATAKKSDVESSQLEKFFDVAMRQKLADAYGSELANSLQENVKWVSDNIKDIQVKKAYQDYVKVASEVDNLDADTSYKLEQALHEKEQRLLTIAKRQCSETEYEILNKQLTTFDEQFKESMRNLRADTTLKYEQGNEAHEKAVYQGLVNMASSQGGRNLIAEKIQTELSNLKKQGRISDKQVRLIQEQTDNLVKANDNYEIQMYSKIITDAIGSVASGAIAGKLFGLFGTSSRRPIGFHQ